MQFFEQHEQQEIRSPGILQVLQEFLRFMSGTKVTMAPSIMGRRKPHVASKE